VYLEGFWLKEAVEVSESKDYFSVLLKGGIYHHSRKTQVRERLYKKKGPLNSGGLWRKVFLEGCNRGSFSG